MIQKLMHDSNFLSQKAQPATADDVSVAEDLLDTLMAHRDSCVGMAANMIGVCKAIIVFENMGAYTTMLNPQIIRRSGAYETEEACLSLLGGPRKCKRYRTVCVRYQTRDMQWREQIFTGWPAQIIQHEVDHCNGILI